jgi:hypothetical protein
MMTWRGRACQVQKTFFQEVCFCGSGEQVDLEGDHDEEIQKGLIGCQVQDCETEWVCL